eukprot:gene7658-380_t
MGGIVGFTYADKYTTFLDGLMVQGGLARTEDDSYGGKAATVNPWVLKHRKLQAAKEAIQARNKEKIISRRVSLDLQRVSQYIMTSLASGYMYNPFEMRKMGEHMFVFESDLL